MKNYKPATSEDLIRFEGYIINNNLQGIKDYVAEGYSPDNCAGGSGWRSYNPLWNVCNSRRDNYDLIKVLLDAGADVTLRPYIWRALDIYVLTEKDIAWMNAQKEKNKNNQR